MILFVFFRVNLRLAQSLTTLKTVI